ncbi:MAG: alpha/beta hydrolase [Chloroflexota bacterium]
MATKGYTEELIYTQSEDELLLEGALIAPDNGQARPLSLVWVHGLTGRFYGPMIVRIGRRLATAGFRFVTGNNRGHDFGTVLWTKSAKARFIGGAWERFDESPRDIGAWVEFASRLGGRGVVLVGHSLGALKATYYVAQRQDQRVAGLILASPPVRAGRVRSDLLALSERMVSEGKGQDLLPWGSIAVSNTLSAQTYLNRAQTGLDFFGVENSEPAVARVLCPIFALLGTREHWVGKAEDLETIKQQATASPRVDTRLFEGADHRYLDHEHEVADAIAAWVDTLPVA